MYPCYKNTEKLKNNTKSIEILKVKNQALEQRISELEAAQQLEKELHPALDPAHPKHAPELIQAVAAWEARYINNKYPHHQHTPAIKAILKDQGITNGRLISRIAAITNPNKNND